MDLKCAKFSKSCRQRFMTVSTEKFALRLMAPSDNDFQISSRSIRRLSFWAYCSMSLSLMRKPHMSSLIILAGPKGQLNAIHGIPCLIASSSTKENPSKCEVITHMELLAYSSLIWGVGGLMLTFCN